MGSLYELKQSDKLWNQNVIAFFKSIGFIQLNNDPSISIQKSTHGTEINIMSMYVNNFLLASTTMTTLKLVKQLLAKEYNMKDIGEVKTIITWQIMRDSAIGTIKIDQSVFIKNLVMEENLTDCNTPVSQ